MIHISIPSTQTLVEADGNRKYDVSAHLCIKKVLRSFIFYDSLIFMHISFYVNMRKRFIGSSFPSYHVHSLLSFVVQIQTKLGAMVPENP